MKTILMTILLFLLTGGYVVAQNLDRWADRKVPTEYTGSNRSGGGDLEISVVSIDRQGWHKWRDNIYVTNRTGEDMVFQVIFRIARTSVVSRKNKLGSKHSPWFLLTKVVPNGTLNQPFVTDDDLRDALAYSDFGEWFSKLWKKSGLSWGIELDEYQCKSLKSF